MIQVFRETLYEVGMFRAVGNGWMGASAGLGGGPVWLVVLFLLTQVWISFRFYWVHQALTAATSHTGYERLLVKDRKSLALGTFHHQMHHRYFEVNYGNLEVPWDKWFGMFHDGTVEAHEALKDRRGRRA